MIKNIYNTSISEIEAIDSNEVLGGGTRGVIVRDREDLRKIIEAPCLAACMALYDKNIRTTFSTANKNNIGADAIICICYDSLDENNKRILERLMNEGVIGEVDLDSSEFLDQLEHDISIKVPISEDDTVGTVSDRFMQIVANFQEQDVLYGKYTITFENKLKYLSSFHYDELEGVCNEKREVNIDNLEKLFEKYKREFIEINNFYYDSGEDIIWETEELYRKHKRYQEKQKEKIKSQDEVNQ